MRTNDGKLTPTQRASTIPTPASNPPVAIVLARNALIPEIEGASILYVDSLQVFTFRPKILDFKSTEIDRANKITSQPKLMGNTHLNFPHTKCQSHLVKSQLAV